MKTVYCTLTARGIVVDGSLKEAAGGARRVLLVQRRRTPPRRPAGGNVVDLDAWKARRMLDKEQSDADVPDVPGWSECGGRYGPAWLKSGGDSRPLEHQKTLGQVWRRLMNAGEALATLSVICVMAALLLRFVGLL